MLINSISASASRRRSGALLVEWIFAMGIVVLLALLLTGFLMFSGHSFAALYNYVDLDDANRIAMDQITADVRQANRITAFTTTSITLDDADGLALRYAYDPNARTVVREKNGVRKVVLTECDRLNFRVNTRVPTGGSYEGHLAATPLTAKVVDVSWMCSRKIFGRKENTESVQTARIVIRKQKL